MNQAKGTPNSKHSGPYKLASEKVAIKADWTIRSDLKLIGKAVRKVKGFLKNTCVMSELQGIELALHEALANAIVHGNHNNPSTSVRICLSLADDQSLFLSVKDAGSGFDPAKVPLPFGKRLLSPNGRGLFLIRELMDEVTFSFGEGTEIRMKRKLPTQGTIRRSPSS